MESPEQVLAYANADFETSDDDFVAAFLSRAGPIPAGPIVDLGCGPGNIAIRLARALPQRTVIGVDGSEQMLAVARQRGASLGNLRFVCARIPSPALADIKAGAIVSNSLLHHLHAPAVFWRTTKATCVPGAPVFVGDLRRPATGDDVDTLVARYARGDPDVLRRDFRASLHAAFEITEIHEQLVAAGLGDFTVNEVGDRHVLITGNIPGTP